MVLTGHQVLTAVSNKNNKDNQGVVKFEDADFFVGDYLLKDPNLKNNYFNADGSGILENLFVFDWKMNEERYNDSYYKGISGNVYGFRIDNLARCPFEWYQYDGNQIVYETYENGEYVLDKNGEKIPVIDKGGYLVVNSHASSYTVGKYGVGSDYDNHFETFMVAGFILERYFYGQNG
jgi:hypothetical protein